MLDCRKCGLNKGLDQFSKSSKKKRGYSYLCKSCHNEYNKTVWYIKNSQSQKESSLKWKKKNHLKVKARVYGVNEEYLIAILNRSNGKC